MNAPQQQHVGVDRRSYSTPGPVSAGMGDRHRATIPPTQANSTSYPEWERKISIG